MRPLAWLAGLALSGVPFAACAAEAAPAAVAEPTISYTVQGGDTLYGLASQFLLHTSDYVAVQRLNAIKRPRRLPTGRAITIPVRLLRTDPVGAHIGVFRGAVSITRNGQPLTPRPGLELGEGDLIATGANAFARLDMSDGSHVTVPSQSRVRVDDLHRTRLTRSVDRTFTVQTGRAESSVAHLQNKDDHYVVRTPVSVSAVRGTQFLVTFNPDLVRATTSVTGGTVAVSGHGGQEPVPVPTNYGVVVSDQGPLTPVALLPSPSLLRPDKPQDEPVVSFQLAPVPEAQGYRVQLGMDAGLLDLFAEATAQTPRVDFATLADGLYFARVNAISADGLEGVPVTYAFERMLNNLSISAPVMSERNHRKAYLFRWETQGAGTRTFRFQLTRSPDLTPVVDESSLAEAQMTVTDLPPGLYVWRVMSRTLNHGRTFEKWSPAQQLRIGE